MLIGFRAHILTYQKSALGQTTSPNRTGGATSLELCATCPLFTRNITWRDPIF